MLFRSVFYAAVKDAIVRNRGLYLCAIGGAGALVSRHVTAQEEVAFLELGCESIKKLTVSDMPLVVGVDTAGNDLFESGRREYEKNEK